MGDNESTMHRNRGCADLLILLVAVPAALLLAGVLWTMAQRTLENHWRILLAVPLGAFAGWCGWKLWTITRKP